MPLPNFNAGNFSTTNYVGGTGPQFSGLASPSAQYGGYTPQQSLIGAGVTNPTVSGFGSPPGGMFSKIGGVLGSPGFANGLGAFSTLASIYTGFKGLGLAKDQLNFQKSSFNKNFNASAKSYETNLKDRWAKRDRAARSRGREFEGMDKWVSSRSIKTGKASQNKVGG